MPVEGKTIMIGVKELKKNAQVKPKIRNYFRPKDLPIYTHRSGINTGRDLFGQSGPTFIKTNVLKDSENSQQLNTDRKKRQIFIKNKRDLYINAKESGLTLELDTVLLKTKHDEP